MNVFIPALIAFLAMRALQGSAEIASPREVHTTGIRRQIVRSVPELGSDPRAADPGAAALRLTLDDAVRRGLETSHRIAEAIARREAVDAVAGERHAAMLPQVAAQAGYTRTNRVDTFGILLPNN